jgi:hypothetical protein
MQNSQNVVSNGLDSKANKQETISELARRHMNNEHHTTTDEELKNAQLELTESVEIDNENLTEVDNTTVIPPLPFESNAKDDADDNDDLDRPIPNPYNVLGS